MKQNNCNFKKPGTVVTLTKKAVPPKLRTSASSYDYQLLHKWKENQPRCLYALLHKTSEAASKVNIEVFKDSSGENAFQFIPSHSLIPSFQRVPFSALYKSVETKFHEALCLYSTVVPSRLLGDVRKDLQELQSKQCLKIVEKGISNVIKTLTDIEDYYKKQVSREMQRQDFSFHHVKGPLNDLGFIVKGSVEQCSICQYGKSLVDMYFYKDGGGIANCALVQGQPDEMESEQHESIVGGVTEFKIDENLNTCFAQIFADMVRVGTSLVYDALIRGVVVDKIIVYGLLVNYKTRLAYPMKYDVDFTKDKTVIFVGGEVDAVKAFMGIVHIMNNY